MKTVARFVPHLARNGVAVPVGKYRHFPGSYRAFQGFCGTKKNTFPTRVKDVRALSSDKDADKGSVSEIMSPKVGEVVNLGQYVDSIRSTLKPPVANRVLYNSSQLKVMIVGGPNERDDFHIEAGEEFFIQLEGDMDLDVMQDGKREAIPIKQSQIYVLSSHVPHSPQRHPNSVGLVIERTRLPSELDTLRWYKKHTNEIEFEEAFYCTDLSTQIKEVIENQKEMREVVKAQGLQLSTLPSEIEPPLHKRQPLDVTTVCASAPSSGMRAYKWLDSEFRVHVYRGSSDTTSMPLEQVGGGETFLYQISGKSVISSVTEEVHLQQTGDVVLLGSHLPYDVQVGAEDLVIGVSNKVTPM
jgi:3-hydroxyanthranilate 3,4-dioxygenase